MDDYQHKNLKTSQGFTYSYYLSPHFHSKLSPSVPTLLWIHGFPDDAHMWEGAVPFFSALPYPMVLIDALGMGGTDKPPQAKYYNYRMQADCIIQILNKEGVGDNVIPIGHDWGSAIVNRFYLYHKKRCIGLCMMSTAYMIPSNEPFDWEGANEATTKAFGYPQWQYWEWFTARDAPEIMRKNPERFFEVLHGNEPSPLPEENGRDIWMRSMFCTPGAMRDYMTHSGKYANFTIPLKPYPNLARTRARYIERLRRDGLEGAVNYYHSLKDNLMLEDERALCAAPDGRDKRIDVPLLYIGQTGDWVCRTDLMKTAKDQGLCPDIEERAIEAGHWCLYEKPETVALVIREWILRRFPVKEYEGGVPVSAVEKS